MYFLHNGYNDNPSSFRTNASFSSRCAMMIFAENILPVNVIYFLMMTVESSESEEYLYVGRTKVVREYHPESDRFTDLLAPRVVEFYSPHCVSFRLTKPLFE